MYNLGIDFGKQGGFALLKDEHIVQKWIMPLTEDNDINPIGVQKIIEEIKEQSTDVKVYGEKLHALFNSSAKSTFSFGQAYGTVIGVIESHLAPVKLVRAVDWQKRIFKDQDVAEVKKKNSKRRDTKIMALHSALKLWPDEVWTQSPRHRKLHDGMIDACLIALYGKRINKE